MSQPLEVWHLLTALFAFFAFCGGGAKVLLKMLQRDLDARFASQEKAREAFHTQLQLRLSGIETAAAREADEWKRIERDLLAMRADLPLNYVRREDYIRGQSVLEAKLDSLHNKLEVVQMRAATKGER